jgi:hypothetical protein
MKTYCISTDSACGKTTARNLREAFEAFRLPFKTAVQWEESVAALGGYGTITEDGLVIARVPMCAAGIIRSR